MHTMSNPALIGAKPNQTLLQYLALNQYILKTLQEIGLHTMSLMNSEYHFTILDNYSMRHTHMLAENSMSELWAKLPVEDQEDQEWKE